MHRTSVNHSRKEGSGPPMYARKKLTAVTCPVCGSGADLHHDVRASLIYACQMCMHEWDIDPAEETSEPERVVESRRTRSKTNSPRPPKR